ncbi:MAG TPA: 50S ribosomal protein L17 [bacterium]|jgi:large subunit ribosomal protein L17|nr:50S ribosomal protein L17 [bacterium]
MRHANTGRKLGRSSSHRRSLMRNLATSLLTHGRIRTTFIKAKELQRVADRLVTLGKRGDLHARRQALTEVFNDAVVARLFTEIAPWYKERRGGYTRVLKLEPRPGDNAPMAFVEFVDRKELGDLKRPVPQKKKFKKTGDGAKAAKAAKTAAAAPKEPKAAAASKPKPAKAPAKPKAEGKKSGENKGA